MTTRPIRRALIAVAGAALLAAAAAPSASAAPVASASAYCGNVILTPNSGHGAFRIFATGISCYRARKLLRSSTGLRSWSCRAIRRYSDGSKRWTCTSRGRRITFTVGS